MLEVWEEVKALNSDAVLFGITRLMTGGWSLKLLARDSVSLKKTIAQLRRILSSQLPELKTIPRMLSTSPGYFLILMSELFLAL